MYDQDITAERTMINRLNQDRDVLVLRSPYSRIAPVVYLDDAYSCHRRGDSAVAISRDIATVSDALHRKFRIFPRRRPKITCIAW